MVKVVERIEKEYKEFIEKCKKNGIDFTISKAKEISDKKYIVDAFIDYYYGDSIYKPSNQKIELDEIDENAILDSDNSLEDLYELYEQWEKIKSNRDMNFKIECIKSSIFHLRNYYLQELEKAKEEYTDVEEKIRT